MTKTETLGLVARRFLKFYGLTNPPGGHTLIEGRWARNKI